MPIRANDALEALGQVTSQVPAPRHYQALARQIFAAIDAAMEDGHTRPEHLRECIAEVFEEELSGQAHLIARLAEVYTVANDQALVIQLVQDAQRLAASWRSGR